MSHLAVEELADFLAQKNIPNVLLSPEDYERAEHIISTTLKDKGTEVLACVDNCPPNSVRHYRLFITRHISEGTIRLLQYKR